jgi:hypothetical protein
MNGATAKAVRRDLRRAMGEDAVEVVNQHTMVIDNRILPNIGALQKVADDHECRLLVADGFADALKRTADDRWAANCKAQKKAFDQIDAFTGMTLRERLRWLIMGR